MQKKYVKKHYLSSLKVSPHKTGISYKGEHNNTIEKTGSHHLSQLSTVTISWMGQSNSVCLLT